MGRGLQRPSVERVRIAVAFYAIVFIGIGAGAGGVLLPAQITDYAIDKSTVGLIFFTFGAGYVASAAANGALIHRLGTRAHLVLGTASCLAAAALIAPRPSFVILLALQAVFGFGYGVLDAGLNTYLSALSGSTALLNYFHAFFGVGALLGPVAAAAMIEQGFVWNAFYALLAILTVPLLLSLGLYPAQIREIGEVSRPRLSRALRLRMVWIAAAFLGIYVGLETSVGNWGFSFLTEERGQGVLAAGWIVSGYWFGLTLGRFVLNAGAERVGVGLVGLSASCIGGVAISALVMWLAPTATVATAGMVALGFFLGPLFPTMIAALPRLVPEHLVATAIGVLVATSVAGGSLFSWLVGASAQRVGAWALLPVSFALAALLALIWWRISARLRWSPHRTEPVPVEV